MREREGGRDQERADKKDNLRMCPAATATESSGDARVAEAGRGGGLREDDPFAAAFTALTS